MTNRFRSFWRKTAQYMLVCLCGIFAVLYIMDQARWLRLRTIWAVPENTMWYRLNITNDTRETLFVNICLVNDRLSKTYDVYETTARARLGRLRERNDIVAPGKTRLFSIPSEINPQLGIFMITAMTKFDHQGSKKATQKLGLRMLTYPLTNASTQPDEPINIRFRDNDLVTLKIPMLTNWYGSTLTLQESEGLSWITPENWGENPPATEPPPTQ